jgi:hypothetical protein
VEWPVHSRTVELDRALIAQDAANLRYIHAFMLSDTAAMHEPSVCTMLSVDIVLVCARDAVVDDYQGRLTSDAEMYEANFVL